MRSVLSKPLTGARAIGAACGLVSGYVLAWRWLPGRTVALFSLLGGGTGAAALVLGRSTLAAKP